jgi:hypothetical protein
MHWRGWALRTPKAGSTRCVVHMFLYFLGCVPQNPSTTAAPCSLLEHWRNVLWYTGQQQSRSWSKHCGHALIVDWRACARTSCASTAATPRPSRREVAVGRLHRRTIPTRHTLPLSRWTAIFVAGRQRPLGSYPRLLVGWPLPAGLSRGHVSPPGVATHRGSCLMPAATPTVDVVRQFRTQ